MALLGDGGVFHLVLDIAAKASPVSGTTVDAKTPHGIY